MNFKQKSGAERFPERLRNGMKKGLALCAFLLGMMVFCAESWSESRTDGQTESQAEKAAKAVGYEKVDGHIVVAPANKNDPFESVCMEKIVIPAEVDGLPVTEFSLGPCWIFQEFSVAEENTTFQSIDGVLFTKDGKTLVKFPNGSKKAEYTVPNGVERIENGAFCRCWNLKSVVIPSSVTSIGKNAFNGSRESN